MQMQSVDVVIVGGGMVGLALAGALKNSPLQVAVVEAQLPNPTLEARADLRVSALSVASQRLLDNMDVWAGICARRYQAYEQMSVWERDSFAYIDFSAASVRQNALGWIVENRVIQLSLLEAVSQSSNIRLLAPAKIQQLQYDRSGAMVLLDDGRALACKLIVAADGAHSWVREQADIPLTSWDYDHHALVATVRCQEPHLSCARQVFSATGPLAFLPLWQPNLCSIVWSLPSDQAQWLTQCDENQFNRRLTAAFDARLGLCSLEGERQSIALRARYARDFAKDRLVLVGDAAHTIHPLAGQGVNLGLLDAAALAQELLKHQQLGHDIGRLPHLRHYERWRKSEAAQMLAAMEGLKQLFSGAHPLKKWLRGVGLMGVNQLTSVKHRLIRQAMGLEGDLPQLARFADGQNS